MEGINKFDLAVFDIAGTTVKDKDFVAVAFIEAFTQYGVDVTCEEINPLMGFKKTEAIATVLEAKGQEVTEEKVAFIHNIFVSVMIQFYSTSAEVEPLPFAESIFSLMKSKGIKVALNSGFPRVIVDTIVDRMQWLEKGLLDDVIASDEVDRGRPYPDMISILMQRAGITDPARVLKIGDTMVDIQEGRNVGCGLVLGITSGAYDRTALEPFNPDAILDSLEELKSFI